MTVRRALERAQDFGQTHLVEEVDEQIGRGRAAVDHEQFARFRSREDGVDLATMFEIDEVCLGMKALQCRVLVVAVDRAMIVAAIFQILHEVRGEEALSDSAFAVDDEVDLFGHGKLR